MESFPALEIAAGKAKTNNLVILFKKFELHPENLADCSKSDQSVLRPSYSSVLIIIFQTVQDRTSASITSRDSRASTS